MASILAWSAMAYFGLAWHCRSLPSSYSTTKNFIILPNSRIKFRETKPFPEYPTEYSSMHPGKLQKHTTAHHWGPTQEPLNLFFSESLAELAPSIHWQIAATRTLVSEVRLGRSNQLLDRLVGVISLYSVADRASIDGWTLVPDNSSAHPSNRRLHSNIHQGYHGGKVVKARVYRCHFVPDH